jgi:CRISPR-associated endonuclease/helicase Cas3
MQYDDPTKLVARFCEKDGREQPLVDHLEGVANFSAEFCARFGLEKVGRLIGLCHDTEKRNAIFQTYIQSKGLVSRGTFAHAQESAANFRKTVAARFFKRSPESIGALISIYCHHVGLPDLNYQSFPPYGWGAEIGGRLSEIVNRSELSPFSWLEARLETLGAIERSTPELRGDLCAQEMLIRFLFSSLCDADGLDAGIFDKPIEARIRREGFQTIAQISARLTRYIDDIAQRNANDSDVMRWRGVVRTRCQEAAELEPGVFFLTVPTGYGKTLSGLEFSLRHAARWGKDRVIVVAPFNAINEQTGRVFKRALGRQNVLEHYSSYDETAPIQDGNERQYTWRDNVVSVNWAAPVVISTMVQFFESLNSNRIRKSRKVHNFANSVIFIDEAQAIPASVLFPVLDELDSLVRHFGVTVLVSTATVPLWDQEGQKQIRNRILSTALSSEKPKLQTKVYGFSTFTRIAPEVPQLPARRVNIVWPTPEELGRQTTWPDLAQQIVGEKMSTLIKVDHRKDVQDLCLELDALRTEAEVIALSALLTPRDRTTLIARIQVGLRAGKLMYVVSTSLIETGVDINFPRGFMTMSGVDAVIQFAGRMDREGLLGFDATLKLFVAPKNPWDALRSTAIGTTLSLLNSARQRGETTLDVYSPEIQREYWSRWLLRNVEQLKKGDDIQFERRMLNYETVAKKFKMIENTWSTPLVIIQDEASAAALASLKSDTPRFGAVKRLQKYQVNVSKTKLDKWLAANLVQLVGSETMPDLLVLERPTAFQYNARFGLQIDYLDVQAETPAVLIA